jgi:hypothetical protein
VVLPKVDPFRNPEHGEPLQLKEGVFGVVPKEAVPFGGNPLE